MHLALVNRLGSMPRGSVVRVTDRLDMTIVVYWDVKPQIKHMKFGIDLSLMDDNIFAILC